MADPLPIDALTDLSCVRDDGTIGFTAKRISGGRVALEWVLRSWFGFLVWGRKAWIDVRHLENADHSRTERQVWRLRLESRAREVDYVASCQVALSPSEGDLVVSAFVTLINGLSYPLAVTIGEAGRAIVTLGEPT